jgi:hypothetical protein
MNHSMTLQTGAPTKEVPLPWGLTSAEARSRFATVRPERSTPTLLCIQLRRALTKFRAPVPWMLETFHPIFPTPKQRCMEMTQGQRFVASACAGCWPLVMMS